MPFFQKLKELNLFETNATDASSIRIQRLSTRFYLSIFTITLLILSIYASLHKIILLVEIHNPTIDLYHELEAKYSMECSCSETSIRYGELMNHIPTYHQVCSSDFVTQRWIDALFDSTKTPFYFPIDFRSTASQQFQLLAALCQSSARGINDSLQSFFRSELISEKLMIEDFFLTKIRADIDTFKNNTLDAFDYKLIFIRDTIQGNILLPSIGTILNFYFHYIPLEHEPLWIVNTSASAFILPHENSLCTCEKLPTCYTRARIFGDNLFGNYSDGFDYLYIIDEWYIGCRPIDSLLLSTLKTFYNQTEINSFLNFFPNILPNFTCLNANETSRFQLNDTLKTIVKNGFIEKWIQQENYSSYFNKCAPELCSYTINKRFNIYYILTAIIGVYGGLSIGLRLIIPIIIKFIFQRNEETSVQGPSIRRPIQFICYWFQQLISALVKMNLFRSAIHIEPSDIYQQCWTTRFYIICFLHFLIFVTMYTAIIEQTNHIDVLNPSLDEVLDLQKRTNIKFLQCPCSQISSSFKNYVELIPTIHEICSSDFVSYAWIYFFADLHTTYINDINGNGFMFQLLQSFCYLANTTIINARNLFYETQLVTANLMNQSLFESQMKSEGDNFKRVISDRFFYPLEMIRQTTKANQFIYGKSANYRISMQNDTGYLFVDIDPVVVWNDDNGSVCSLLFEPICKLQTLYTDLDIDKNPVRMPVPGLYTSAYYVDSLLLSQLQCLYNQSCIDIIKNHPYYYIIAMSQTSNFSNNVTFQLLLDRLFVEFWSQELNYTAYFRQCQPLLCSYKTEEQPTFIALITSVIGLSGSISAVLGFLSPLIISLIFKYCRRTQQRRLSEVTQQEGKHFLKISTCNIEAQTIYAM
ncbi:unnamed protein product [Adineta steineri]|uniref:Uncharacterized protein n=1 Tax=Adineta steineri TaxID=433720 RepID=A0A819LNA0_9BILA|nr:unnamed protein product [Adineta steineri]CAF3968875.1 unnamed protein product [Adineta steineri]